MPRRGLPVLMGYIAPPVEFIGGLMILAGFVTRYAALLILVFTFIASLSSQAHWQYAMPAERAQHFTHFFKNLTMKGGLLLLFITGAGPISVDERLRRK